MKLNPSTRIPFYFLIKTLFLLYLALPQTRGSSYLYITHLQPFFHSHEAQIDATLASLKARIYSFLQERLRMLWEHVAATVRQQQQQDQRGAQPNFTPVGLGGTSAPPTLGNPIAAPATLISSLWQSYGPGIIAGGAALLRQSAASTSGTAASSTTHAFVSPPVTPPAARRQGESSQSLYERRRQLEAELASLPPVELAPLPGPGPGVGSSSYEITSRNSSDADLRGRSASSTGMRFEEIEVPSDVEGYDVGAAGGSGKPAGSSGTADAAKRSSGWFSGWGSPGKEGEKTKSD